MFTALLWGIGAAAPPSAATYHAALAAPEGWQEVAVRHHDQVGDIRVRHKKVAGLDCLEGIAMTEAAIEPMLQAARDIEGSMQWSSAKLVDSVSLTSGNTFDYYQVLDNPFPLKDRYWFLRGTTHITSQQTEFRWEHIDPDKTHPRTIGAVRAKFPDAVSTGVNVGAWVFEPQGGKTQVRYRLCSDPGGSVPAWAGHKAAELTLPQNIADLISHATGSR